MPVVVYGITPCDQVRKTLAWLNANGVDHRFHDFRRDGLSGESLERWCSHVPWNALLNKRGQTWRGLPEVRRRQVVDQSSAIELLLEQPTLVKRPVIEIEDGLLLGFSIDRIDEALHRHGLAPPDRVHGDNGAGRHPARDRAGATAASPAAGPAPGPVRPEKPAGR
ncbi:MAG: arsenate reductase [Burkholderiaceae bacterium]|jgi:arsenate reductase